jgi:hypothetical protein
MRTHVLVTAICFTLVGCASGTAATTASPSQRTNIERRTNVISSEEIAAGGVFQSASDIVRRLRPGWPQNLEIWLDANLYGDYSTLNQIAANRVREIHSLSKSEAQMKWTTSRVGAVIWVVSK